VIILEQFAKQVSSPNFFGGSRQQKLYLVRCFICDPERGKENCGTAVATGTCGWCGWSFDDYKHLRDIEKPASK